jgi:hypothetical protein
VIIVGGGVFGFWVRGELKKPTSTSSPPVAGSKPVSSVATDAASVSVASDAGTGASGALDAATIGDAPVVDESGGDGKDLGPTYGYLLVRSGATHDVYASGIKLGPTNKKNQAPCGVRFVRLGEKEPPTWLNAGKSIEVKCRDVTTIEMEPR